MFVRFTKQLMQQEYSHSADETPDLGNRPTASVSRLTKRQSVRVDMMGSWGCMHAGGKRGGTTQINWRVGEWRRRRRRARACLAPNWANPHASKLHCAERDVSAVGPTLFSFWRRGREEEKTVVKR